MRTAKSRGRSQTSAGKAEPEAATGFVTARATVMPSAPAAPGQPGGVLAPAAPPRSTGHALEVGGGDTGVGGDVQRFTAQPRVDAGGAQDRLPPRPAPPPARPPPPPPLAAVRAR